MYINLPNDFTLAPPNQGRHALLTAVQNRGNISFDEARNKNRIYAGNGLICQRKMCEDMHRCSDVSVCQSANPEEWKKVVEFCGPIGTTGLAMDGGWWRLEPANSRQLMDEASKRATGLQVLPTFYNARGMY